MDTAPTKPSLSKKPSPSFRLRNGSLNSLRLRRVFDLFDRNGDGKITLDEMESALDTLGLGLGADRASLEATVSAYTPAGAAGFGFDDFESLHRALSDTLFGPIVEDEEDEDVKEAFRVFDEDGDGFISAAELQTVLMKKGVYDQESQLAHFVAAGRSKGQLASKLLFLSKASTYIGVLAGIQQPASTAASFFASHQSVYYGLVAVVMAAVPVEVATAFWLPRSRSPRFHAFAEILYHAGVFVLVVAAAIGGFQITHKA